MKNVGITIAVLVAVVALAIGGYGLYWWLAKDTTAKRYEVNTGTQQYQAGLISQNRDRYEDYHRAVDLGQKEALRNAFCATHVNINPLPADLERAGFELQCGG